MKHPTFNGKPILVGDEIIVKRKYGGALLGDERHKVAEVRWVEHYDEVWIHLAERRGLVIHEGDIEAHFQSIRNSAYVQELPLPAQELIERKSIIGEGMRMRREDSQ